MRGNWRSCLEGGRERISSDGGGDLVLYVATGESRSSRGDEVVLAGVGEAAFTMVVLNQIH